jgi:phage head maturation protease
MGGFKVLDTKEGDNIWNNFIKTGKVKGFSVEGNFITNFSRLKNDEYLLQEIINILNKITD